MYTFAIGEKKLLTFLGVGIALALQLAPTAFAQSSRPVKLESFTSVEVQRLPRTHHARAKREKLRRFRRLRLTRIFPE